MSGAKPSSPAQGFFHVMAKPIGPICNLKCRYCFYLEKRGLYPGKSRWRMSDEVLEQFIRQYIESQNTPEITFAWQGGEPTLLGVDFFRKVVRLQERYADGRRVRNSLQTNGTLLDDNWCEFLRENGFLIGLSIDGPRELHDRYRTDRRGQPTFDRVMRGLALLKKHQVDFNALCVVNRINSGHPLEVYRFLRDEGSGFIQFIPLVERAGPGQLLSGPPRLRVLNDRLADERPGGEVTAWSVEPLAFGKFLCSVFDEWVRRDVGRTFVQIFDVMLGVWMGMPASLCVFSQTCGNAVALEHNGDLFACDHYVYPEYRLGNIMAEHLGCLARSAEQVKFGLDKRDLLPGACRKCDVLFACNGECPKHRFLKTEDGEDGVNYLCAGYRHFLHHVDPYMSTMAQLLRRGRPAADIMALLAAHEAQQARLTDWAAAGRNDPCPCGSGKKFKKCCWDQVRAAGPQR